MISPMLERSRPTVPEPTSREANTRAWMIGEPPRPAERTSKGHADRFWSVVLACQTERAPVGGATSDIGALVVG